MEDFPAVWVQVMPLAEGGISSNAGDEGAPRAKGGNRVTGRIAGSRPCRKRLRETGGRLDGVIRGNCRIIPPNDTKPTSQVIDRSWSRGGVYQLSPPPPPPLNPVSHSF